MSLFHSGDRIGETRQKLLVASATETVHTPTPLSILYMTLQGSAVFYIALHPTASLATKSSSLHMCE